MLSHITKLGGPLLFASSIENCCNEWFIIGCLHVIGSMLAKGNYHPESVHSLFLVISNFISHVNFSVATYYALLEISLGLKPTEISSLNSVQRALSNEMPSLPEYPRPYADFLQHRLLKFPSTIFSILSIINTAKCLVPLSFALCDLSSLMESRDNNVKLVRIIGWQNYLFRLLNWELAVPVMSASNIKMPFSNHVSNHPILQQKKSHIPSILSHPLMVGNSLFSKVVSTVVPIIAPISSLLYGRSPTESNDNGIKFELSEPIIELNSHNSLFGIDEPEVIADEEQKLSIIAVVRIIHNLYTHCMLFERNGWKVCKEGLNYLLFLFVEKNLSNDLYYQSRRVILFGLMHQSSHHVQNPLLRGSMSQNHIVSLRSNLASFIEYLEDIVYFEQDISTNSVYETNSDGVVKPESEWVLCDAEVKYKPTNLYRDHFIIVSELVPLLNELKVLIDGNLLRIILRILVDCCALVSSSFDKLFCVLAVLQFAFERLTPNGPDREQKDFDSLNVGGILFNDLVLFVVQRLCSLKMELEQLQSENNSLRDEAVAAVLNFSQSLAQKYGVFAICPTTLFRLPMDVLNNANALKILETIDIPHNQDFTPDQFRLWQLQQLQGIVNVSINQFRRLKIDILKVFNRPFDDNDTDAEQIVAVVPLFVDDKAQINSKLSFDSFSELNGALLDTVLLFLNARLRFLVSIERTRQLEVSARSSSEKNKLILKLKERIDLESKTAFDLSKRASKFIKSFNLSDAKRISSADALNDFDHIVVSSRWEKQLTILSNPASVWSNYIFSLHPQVSKRYWMVDPIENSLRMRNRLKLCSFDMCHAAPSHQYDLSKEEVADIDSQNVLSRRLTQSGALTLALPSEATSAPNESVEEDCSDFITKPNVPEHMLVRASSSKSVIQDNDLVDGLLIKSSVSTNNDFNNDADSSACNDNAVLDDFTQVENRSDLIVDIPVTDRNVSFDGAPQEIKTESVEIRDNIAAEKLPVLKERINSESWEIVEEPNESVPISLQTLVYAASCWLVLPFETIEGRIEVSPNTILFTTHHQYKTAEQKNEEAKRALEEGIFTQFVLPALDGVRQRAYKTRRWAIKDVHMIYRRRYQLQRTALEIFFLNGKNYFFEFGIMTERNRCIQAITIMNPPRLIPLCSRHALELLKISGIVEKLINSEISNFEYLMHLNTISGRTYNDLNQYPVFPWIISDYLSNSIDLTDPKVYRDLSKPIGALDDSRLEQILSRYLHFKEGEADIPAFHYGSHYSNAAIVLFYLMRLEPFAALHVELQGGKFDYPDRLFSSISTTYDSCLTSLSCFKELIPEFFYMPEFLENVNNYNLGKTQAGDSISTVSIPPWAKNAEDFIRINRMALESDYVSEHLHKWVDLIFGFKQTGVAAEDSHNLFFHLTYEGAVDLNKIKDKVMLEAIRQQIAQFGQTPIQLFKHPHPPRRSKAITLPKEPALLYYTNPLMRVIVCHSEPVVAIQLFESKLFTCSATGLIGTHKWSDSQPSATDSSRGIVLSALDLNTAPLSNSSVIPFTLEISPTKCNNNLHPVLTASSPSIRSLTPMVFTRDGRFLITVSELSPESIIVCDSNYSGPVPQIVQLISRHKSRITSLALSTSGILVSGSIDGVIYSWDTNTSLSKVAYPISMYLLGGTNRPIDTDDVILNDPRYMLRGHSSIIEHISVDSDSNTFWSSSILTSYLSGFFYFLEY